MPRKYDNNNFINSSWPRVRVRLRGNQVVFQVTTIQVVIMYPTTQVVMYPTTQLPTPHQVLMYRPFEGTVVSQ